MGRSREKILPYHVVKNGYITHFISGKATLCTPLPLVYRRVVDQIVLAAEARPDLIVVTCSSTSPAVDIARRLVPVPILTIADPMMAEAARSGTRIGLLCTASSTVEPSSALLRAHASEQGREVAIRTMLCPEAYQALMAGDRARHDAMLLEAANGIAGEVDVLVLAQASLAHLRDPLAAALGCPVLASPPTLMREVARRCAP